MSNTPAFTQEDISKNKAMAILAYLGVLVLVPLFAAKDSPYARFHTNQGIILWILGLIARIITSLVKSVTALQFIMALICIAIGVFGIIGIVYAATGKAKALPLIGSIKILK